MKKQKKLLTEGNGLGQVVTVIVKIKTKNK